jgi:hypothetical protein
VDRSSNEKAFVMLNVRSRVAFSTTINTSGLRRGRARLDVINEKLLTNCCNHLFLAFVS